MKFGFSGVDDNRRINRSRKLSRKERLNYIQRAKKNARYRSLSEFYKLRLKPTQYYSPITAFAIGMQGSLVSDLLFRVAQRAIYLSDGSI